MLGDSNLSYGYVGGEQRKANINDGMEKKEYTGIPEATLSCVFGGNSGGGRHQVSHFGAICQIVGHPAIPKPI